MELSSLVRKSDNEWWIPQTGAMRVPGVIYGSEALVREMDEKVREQVTNVAMLPGIQRASYVMPDAHWATDSRLGAWPPSIRRKAASSRPVAWDSTSRARPHAAHATDCGD
jgi:hypothetical protein